MKILEKIKKIEIEIITVETEMGKSLIIEEVVRRVMQRLIVSQKVVLESKSFIFMTLRPGKPQNHLARSKKL